MELMKAATGDQKAYYAPIVESNSTAHTYVNAFEKVQYLPVMKPRDSVTIDLTKLIDDRAQTQVICNFTRFKKKCKQEALTHAVAKATCQVTTNGLDALAQTHHVLGVWTGQLAAADAGEKTAAEYQAIVAAVAAPNERRQYVPLYPVNRLITGENDPTFSGRTNIIEKPKVNINSAADRIEPLEMFSSRDRKSLLDIQNIHGKTWPSTVQIPCADGQNTVDIASMAPFEFIEECLAESYDCDRLILANGKMKHARVQMTLPCSTTTALDDQRVILLRQRKDIVQDMNMAVLAPGQHKWFAYAVQQANQSYQIFTANVTANLFPFLKLTEANLHTFQVEFTDYVQLPMSMQLKDGYLVKEKNVVLRRNENKTTMFASEGDRQLGQGMLIGVTAIQSDKTVNFLDRFLPVMNTIEILRDNAQTHFLIDSLGPKNQVIDTNNIEHQYAYQRLISGLFTHYEHDLSFFPEYISRLKANPKDIMKRLLYVPNNVGAFIFPQAKESKKFSTCQVNVIIPDQTADVGLPNINEEDRGKFKLSIIHLHPISFAVNINTGEFNPSIGSISTSTITDAAGRLRLVNKEDHPDASSDSDAGGGDDDDDDGMMTA